MGGVRQAWVHMAHGAEPGDARLGAMVHRLGPREVIARAADGDPSIPDGVRGRLAQVCVEEAEARAAALGARIVVRGESEWPRQLDDLGVRAPYALWVTGAADLRLALVRSVSVVGARACTAYGEEVSRRWSAELAQCRVTVVSGGAFGIDAAAHRGALLTGLTVCVVAGGVDVAYPRAHASLLARIADDGLVVSESPPGQAVRRQRFLSRNRLIAALTRATVVVEAADRSGTASTAREAHDLNRPVAAVPGPVTSAASTGCHRLIRDHEAVLVTSHHDVLELLGDVPVTVPPTRGGDPVHGLGRSEQVVHDAMHRRRAMGLDDLVRACGLDVGEVTAALGLLEVGGHVRASDQGWRLLP